MKYTIKHTDWADGGKETFTCLEDLIEFINDQGGDGIWYNYDETDWREGLHFTGFELISINIMIKIIFTPDAEPISDFKAQDYVEATLSKLTETSDLTITTSNLLIWQMFQGYYADTHQHLKKVTTWWHEDCQVDMDEYMRTDQMWQYPCTDLSNVALEKIFGM